MKLRYLFLSLAWICQPVLALELGQVVLRSHLNEPLEANLDLRNTDSLQLESVRFSIAGDATYQRLLGGNRPLILGDVSFVVISSQPDQHALQMKTRARVIDPIVDLLLQVNEPDNSFIRQFTLLLDPRPLPTAAEAEPAAAQVEESEKPIATSADSQPAPSAQSADVRTQSMESELEQPIASTLPGESQQSAPLASEPQQPAVENGRVIRVKDRSISIIAQNMPLHERYSVYQIMRALYLENPGVFLRGNIDKLITGSELIVPDETLVAEVSRNEAIRFVLSMSRDYPGQENMPSPAASDEVDIKTEIEPSETPLKSAVAAEVVNDPVVPAEETVIDEAVVMLSSGAAVEAQQKIVEQQQLIHSINQDLSGYQNKISQLTERLELIEAQRITSQNQSGQQSTAAAARMLAEQTQVINEQRMTIAELGQQLELKNLEIIELNVQIFEIQQRDTQSTVGLPATQQQDTVATPVQESPVEIVTYPQQQQGTKSIQLWLGLLSLLLMIFIAFREWFWQRKLRVLRLRSGDGRQSEELKRSRPSTYAPSKQDDGEFELKDLTSAKKKKEKDYDETVVMSSPLKLDIDSVPDAKVQIDILLAYEQYEEAMSLLRAAKEKFGNKADLDIKELEILGSSRQCDRFFERFNETKSALSARLPEAWVKVEDMHKRLCKDFKISVVK